MNNYQKYRKYTTIDLPDRTWPAKRLDTAPQWCSVDLRDGNQSLPIPMSVEEKVELFQLLVNIGFKEIEVGFPSASETEFRFLRTLVERKLIPDDVKIQVLVQCREHLINRTFEALEGVKNAVVHFYNSTSTIQRKVVFKKTKEEISEIAIAGAKMVKRLAAKNPDINVQFEYSPESFTGTEMEYAVEVCNLVIDELQPTADNKLIINLPATVEMITPNIYADQIEWCHRNLKNRDNIIISLHTHNDRGTGVAATELALMAGADRVEGTLFGNGERTGNLDLVTVALNLFTQGVNPNLDFSDIQNVAEIYKRVTRMSIHERHPYVGELVYTAFSGSHQDAINKGLAIYKANNEEIWDVPYLPIDPLDVGREYEAIIRINSQSGKGGVAYIMESEFGFKMPKSMHPEFGTIVQVETDKTGDELKPESIYELFKKEYLDIDAPLRLKNYEIEEKQSLEDEAGIVIIKALISYNGEGNQEIEGQGNGPIDAFSNALKHLNIIPNYKLSDYAEHALDSGSDAKAATYIQLKTEGGETCFGVGVSSNTTKASLKALVCAINRTK